MQGWLCKLLANSYSSPPALPPCRGCGFVPGCWWWRTTSSGSSREYAGNASMYLATSFPLTAPNCPEEELHITICLVADGRCSSDSLPPPCPPSRRVPAHHGLLLLLLLLPPPPIQAPVFSCIGEFPEKQTPPSARLTRSKIRAGASPVPLLLPSDEISQRPGGVSSEIGGGASAAVMTSLVPEHAMFRMHSSRISCPGCLY